MEILPYIRVVSHIQDFGDAPASPYEDTAYPVRDAAPTSGRCDHPPLEMHHLCKRCTSPTINVASPAKDASSSLDKNIASPKSWMCDTAELCTVTY